MNPAAPAMIIAGISSMAWGRIRSRDFLSPIPAEIRSFSISPKANPLKNSEFAVDKIREPPSTSHAASRDCFLRFHCKTGCLTIDKKRVIFYLLFLRTSKMICSLNHPDMLIRENPLSSPNFSGACFEDIFLHLPDKNNKTTVYP